MAAAKSVSLESMTGYASNDAVIGESHFRIETKSLNHRYLDLKIRLPRDLQRIEPRLRSLLQATFKRGSIELKIESSSEKEENLAEFKPNLAVAAHYYEGLIALQKTLGLTDEIRTQDLLAFPDVISRKGIDPGILSNTDGLWELMLPALETNLQKLRTMRALEGQAHFQALHEMIGQVEKQAAELRTLRKKCEESYQTKIKEKISRIFDHHRLDTNMGVPAGIPEKLLETRIAQELAILLDRTDIEEELTRLEGHLEHFKKTLQQGGPVGRKLDFLLQEINREVNTLGNKAQDLPISEEVVQIKVRVEQLRELAMNLE